MSTRAKVFKNGRSQAIRLPKAFRVTGTEVTLKRVPSGILISERDPWDACREACGELSDKFLDAMAKRNVNLAADKRDWTIDE